MTRLVAGSRSSKLALTQTHIIIDALQSNYPNIMINIREISTEGDMRIDAALPSIGGKGVFIKELELALLSNEIDFAVHSLKDMPTEITPGLQLAAVPARADARDVLISRNNRPLEELPQRAVIGTGSPRRACQLLAYRSDLKISQIRGNVETRIRKLDEGQYDAVILAAAGLERMGLNDHITQYLEPEVMIPAVGQGALAIELREGDAEMFQLFESVRDRRSTATTSAERAFLGAMGGGCSAPITAYAQITNEKLSLLGMAAFPDGSQLLRAELSGEISEAKQIGKELARRMLASGADKIVNSLQNET